METFNDLIQNPLYKAEDLGQPLPNSLHAVSVCLPTWADVIGYEEKEQRVLEKLQLGYPRFVLHPLVKELNCFLQEKLALKQLNQGCLAMPCKESAARGKEFLNKRFQIHSSVIGFQDIYVLAFPSQAFNEAKQFWQHSGEIVSSRQAAFILETLKNENNVYKTKLENLKYRGNIAKQNIKERISFHTNVKEENIYLFESGMAAIYFSYLICNHLAQQLKFSTKTVQFGFPYTDTLKIQEKFNYETLMETPNREETQEGKKETNRGLYFFPKGDKEDLTKLTKLLETEKISALYCEFPSNPLLQSVDLDYIKELSQKYSFPIIVDDTIGSFQNIDLTKHADIIVSSLTKFFSGESNCTAGSLILNPQSPFYERLSQILDNLYLDNLWPEDAIVLEENSRSFSQRMKTINQNAEALCDFLNGHPKVQKIYYPKFIDTKNYKELQSSQLGAGYGGLFSLELVNPAKNAPLFYDKIKICKGPSLGTNFTIACPYTLLAHYDELDFVEECGVSRYLIRFSVGMEEPDELIKRFAEALSVLS